MRLNKVNTYAVSFAKCCKNYAIDPSELAEIVQLCDRIAKASEKECNLPNYTCPKHLIKRLELVAKASGLRIEYNGLRPSVYRGRIQLSIPEYVG